MDATGAAKEAPVATKAAELYEEDFYAWTRDQATALRRAIAERHDIELLGPVPDLGSA